MVELVMTLSLYPIIHVVSAASLHEEEEEEIDEGNVSRKFNVCQMTT